MYQARHNRFYLGIVVTYFKLLFRINFRGIRVTGEMVNVEGPVLLLQNHFSWWDGYWSLYLSRKIFRKEFYVMMLENEMNRRMFLSRCGVFSIRKNGKGAFDSLTYAAGLLNSAGNLVAIFPQGEIISLNNQEFRFGKGPEWILKKNRTVNVYFAVVLIDYFSNPRPVVTIYLKHHTGDIATSCLQLAYNVFYKECVGNQKSN